MAQPPGRAMSSPGRSRGASGDPVLENRWPVLLVEFVNADQFPGRVSYLFPVVSGYYRQHGCPLRWIRFGISTTHMLAHQRDEITLSEGELRRLLEVADEHSPRLVILTDPLHEPQMEALAAHAPGATTEFMGTSGQGHRLAEARDGLTNDPEFRPHYDWEPGNEAGAARTSDNVYLLLDGSCGHWLSLANNPLYAGIHDDRLRGRVGCTFCQSRREDRAGPTRAAGCGLSPSVARAGSATPAEWIRRQIRAIASSRGSPERYPNALLLEQLGSPAILRTCVETMRACGMAGRTQILLAVRSNNASWMAEVLQEHFSDHDGAGLTIGVYANGIESFAAEDLLRFNKGTTPLDSLRAINTHRELSRKYPGRFSFTGVSLLLFTPWTTLETLSLNVGILRLLRVTRAEMGNMFQSRLRMHEDLPITILAEREGLLLDNESDPVLIMNRRKLFSGERAWRFKDPRMRPLSRLVLRFDLIGTSVADPLTTIVAHRLSQAVGSLNNLDDAALLDILSCLVDTVQAHERPLDELELLQSALERWRARREELDRTPPSVRFRIGEERVDLSALLARTLPLLRIGARQVMSVEHVSRAEVKAAAQVLTDLPFALVDEAGGAAIEWGMLLVASTREALAERVALQRILGSSDVAALPDAIERTGCLHGVPACCAHAYASSPFGPPDLRVWAAFCGRMEAPSPVPDDANPLWIPSIGFVPCSPTCVHARSAFEAWLHIIAAPAAARTATGWLFTLEGHGDGVLIGLPVRGASDDGVDYEPDGIAPGDGPLRQVLRRGESLRMAPGQILVRRGSETIASLSSTHGLWFSQRVWHAAEWRELARGVVLAATEPVGSREVTGGLDERRARRRSPKLEQVLGVVIARLGDAVRGAEIQRACFDGPGSAISLTISLDGAWYDLQMAARGGNPCLFQTEHFEVRCSRQTPLTVATHLRKVQLVALGFDRLASRHAPEFVPGPAMRR